MSVRFEGWKKDVSSPCLPLFPATGAFRFGIRLGQLKIALKDPARTLPFVQLPPRCRSLVSRPVKPQQPRYRGVLIAHNFYSGVTVHEVLVYRKQHGMEKRQSRYVFGRYHKIEQER